MFLERNCSYQSFFMPVKRIWREPKDWRENILPKHNKRDMDIVKRVLFDENTDLIPGRWVLEIQQHHIISITPHCRLVQQCRQVETSHSCHTMPDKIWSYSITPKYANTQGPTARRLSWCIPICTTTPAQTFHSWCLSSMQGTSLREDKQLLTWNNCGNTL